MRDNLILRGNTYHVRLALPANVRPFFGNRKLLSQSLKTGLQQEAKDRARPILLDWKNQIAEAKQTQASQAEQWREELARVGTLSQRSLTRKVMKAVQGKPSLLESKGADYVDGVLEALSPIYSQMAADFKAAGVPDELTSKIFESIKAELQSGGLESIPTMQNTTALLNEARIVMASNQYQLTGTEQAEASTILASPKTYKPKSPITVSMLTRWRDHLNDQIETEKTRDSHRSRVQRLSNFLTEQGHALCFDSVHAFLATLPPAKITRANYLWSCRSFWHWANKYEKDFRERFVKESCPFDGHELPRVGDATGVKREEYTRKQIEDLCRAARSKSDGVLANLIIVASYTGARLEEVGRIRPEDTIFSESGEPMGFRILEAKTAAGIREVPLHPALVPLFKELSANATGNDGYLFPGGDNKYGNRLDSLSKRFGRLKTSMGYGKLYTFHSIRHSVTTMLHQAGVSIEILPYITGHKQRNFTLSVYSAGASFEQKAEAISLLSFAFD